MKKSKKGFTIVEVLVVIILISLLATVVASKVFPDIDKQKEKITRIKITSLENSIQRFVLDCGRYPESSEGLEALIDCPQDLVGKWDGPYLKKGDLIDAWENPFIYVANETANSVKFEVISLGKDGVEGGAGYAADIYND